MFVRSSGTRMGWDVAFLSLYMLSWCELDEL